MQIRLCHLPVHCMCGRSGHAKHEPCGLVEQSAEGLASFVVDLADPSLGKAHLAPDLSESQAFPVVELNDTTLALR